MIRPLFLLVSICLGLSLTHSAWAGQIRAVKGKKVLVDMQGDAYRTGDILKIESSSGKTIGLIKVTKTKNNLAEGVFKGKAEKNLTVKLRPAKSKSSTTARSSRPNEIGKSIYGVMIGFNSSKADVKVPDPNTAPVTYDSVSLSGTGFSVKGLMDYQLFSWLGFRGLAGLEQFKVSGGTANGCSGECTAEINYLSADFWGRAFISETGTLRYWGGIGFDLMFPLSKKATALDKSSITNTSVIALGGGLDWTLTSGAYIPVQLEYNIYPSSEDVKASGIALRVGYAKKF